MNTQLICQRDEWTNLAAFSNHYYYCYLKRHAGLRNCNCVIVTLCILSVLLTQPHQSVRQPWTHGSENKAIQLVTNFIDRNCLLFCLIILIRNKIKHPFPKNAIPTGKLFGPRYFGYVEVFRQAVEMHIEEFHPLLVCHLCLLHDPFVLHFLLHLFKRFFRFR